MTYEDLTTYTEVDPGNDFIQTATRNTYDNDNLSRDAYVYKDYGIDFFGDYIHKVDIYCSSLPTTMAQHIMWGVTNIPSSYTDMASGQIVTMGADAIQRIIRLKDKGNGNSDTYVFSLTTSYYLTIKRIGTTLTCKIYSDSSRTILLDTLSITCQTTSWRYLEIAGSYDFGSGTGLTGYSENLNLGQETNISSETINITEDINLKLKLEIKENLFLSEIYTFTQEELIDENINIIDEIETNVSLEKSEQTDSATISDVVFVAFSIFQDLENDFRLVIETRKDISNLINIVILTLDNLWNKIHTVFLVIKNLSQKINTAILTISTFKNAFHSCFGIRKHLLNKINTLGIIKHNVENDFRMKFTWQKAGLAGPQSLGKEYIKVYFNNGGTGDSDIEQTDVDIDSISIGKVINASHNASFVLARPYDASKPAFETIVKIKYNDYLLYKGKIVTINPTDNPEHIRIECLDKYWSEDRNRTWFKVGHIEIDSTVKTFSFVSEIWEQLGVPDSFEGGEFIPQGLDCFGTGKSETLTTLITNCGNFGWYYDVDDSKKIWRGGAGSIVNLERQEIGKNINIYQVLNHQITESVENIVNKLRVELGEKITRTPGTQGETREYKTSWLQFIYQSAIPNWDSNLEVLAKDSSDGYGFDHHKPNVDYSSVFKEFKFFQIMVNPRDPEERKLIYGEGWSDLIPPMVNLERTFGTGNFSIPIGKYGYIKEGYSIDWDSGTLTLNEPFYFYDKAEGRITHLYSPGITVFALKRKYITRTETTEEKPGSEISSNVGFITEKVGDYPIEILEVKSMSGFSNQEESVVGNPSFFSKGEGGGSSSFSSVPPTSGIGFIPGWNDIPYAKDLALWQLSKTCDPKITGTIELTLDAMIYYGIDLTKRIMIPEILSKPLNIISISYNMDRFTATINVENWRYYKFRSNYPSHGTGRIITYNVFPRSN